MTIPDTKDILWLSEILNRVPEKDRSKFCEAMSNVALGVTIGMGIKGKEVSHKKKKKG